MRKQLTLKKLTLFVLSTLLCLLLAIAGITLGSSTQAFADEPTTAPDTPAENPSGHDATHDLQELHVIYPATCVEPGIAVAYCNTCGRNVSVVLDADGVSHSVPLMLKDESGAETIDNSAEGVCELCGAKTGGFNRKVVTEGDDQYVEVSAIEDSALTSITIPAKLAVEEGGEELPVHVKEGAFEGNDTIKEVTIQGAVEVGENAFKDCPNLDTLTIQNGTEIIGANAFEGCEKIAKVELPASVVSIGEDAFNNTGFYNAPESWTGEDLKTLATGSFLLKVATAVPTKPAAPARARRNAPTDPTASYTVDDKIKVIADGALKALKSLTEVNLPAGLKTVGKDAFPETIVTITITAGIEEGSYSIFEGLKFKPEIEVNIYYGGGYAAYLEPLSKLPGFRFLSETEPNDSKTAHNYWYHDKGNDDAITHWAHLKTIEVDTTNATTDFLKESAFSYEGIVVTVTYDDEKNTTRTLTDAEYTVNDSAFDSNTVTKDGECYKITVSYLYVSTSYDVYVRDACIVKLVFNNGEEPTEEHVPVIKGKTYKLPAAPNRPTGYDFAGWLIDGDETLHEPGYEFQVTADITVNAQWTAREPDVKMNYDKGVQGTAQFTAEFDKATETYTVKVSGTPTRTGYTFTGWDYDANGTKGELGAAGGDITVALDDTMTVTVTAKWTVVGLTPTVSYDNGEQGTAEVTAKFDETKESYTVTVKGTPTRTGYKFLGWTVTGGTPTELGVEGGDITVALADEMTVTVTARWEQLYTVSVGDKGEATVTINEEKTYYEKNTVVTFTVKVNPGFKLTNVTADNADVSEQGGTYTFTVGTDNVTITVTTVEVDVNTLVEDATGATLKVAQVGAKATITVEGTPYKMGHDFQNWTVTVNGAPKEYAAELEIELGNEDVEVVYTANWQAKKPNVSLVVGDDAQQNDAKAEVGALTEGKYTISVSGTPTREGYRFDGWTVSGATPETLPADGGEVTVALSDNMTVTLTAKWVDLYTLTVPEIANASVSYEGKKDEYEKGNTVKITITPADGYKVTEEGITVVGADKKVEGNVITVTFASSDVTVTVTVSQVKVTVAFAETYEGVSGSATVDGATATVTIKGEPTKEGYAFTGWTSSVDGGATQGVDVLHYNLKNSDVTITFTAQFEEKEVTEVNATLSVSGTTVSLKLTLGYKGYTEAELKSFKLKIGDKEPLANTSATVTADSKTATLTFELPEELTAGTYALKLLESDKEVYSGKTFSGTNSQFVATTGLEYSLASGELVVTFYGTSDKPLSVDEALKIAEAQCVEENSWTKHPIYVTGKVKENPTASGNSIQFDLVDSVQTTRWVLVYQPTGSDLKSIAQNDVLVIYGSIERFVNYSGSKLEFTGYSSYPAPEIKSRTAGPSTITLGDHTGATVTGFDAGNTLTITNDTTFTFTVTPEGTNWIYSVKAGNETLTAKSGNQYSFTVAGDVTITVKALKSNQRIVYKLAKSDDVIVDGAKVVIASGENLAGTLSGSYLTSISGAQFSDETITELNNATEWMLKEIKQEDAPSQWEIVDASGNKLGATAAKALAFNNGTTTWTISIASSGNANITNTKSSYGSIQYNSSANPKRFLNYTSSQTAIQFYVETVETVVVPYTYDVTEVMLCEDASSLSLMMTISKQPEQEATVSLTVGGQSVEAQLDGDMVTTDPLPLESLTNGAEIVLKIDDVTPTSWGDVSGSVTIDAKTYSLSVSEDGKSLTLKIVDSSAPESEDQKKVDQVHEALSIEKTDLTENLTLPTTDVDGVNLSWSVTVDTPEADANSAKVVDNVLQIDRGKIDIVITLKVVITCGETARRERTWTLTIKAEEGGGEEAKETLLYTLHQTILSDKSSVSEYNGYATYCNVDDSDMTWNVCGNVTLSSAGGWAIGGKGGSNKNSITTADREISSTTPIKGKVTQITFVLGTTKNSNITVNSITLKVYDVSPTVSTNSAPTYTSSAIFTSTAFSYKNGEKCVVSAPDDADWTNKYYQLVINVTLKGTSNTYVTISSMEFTGYSASADETADDMEVVNAVYTMAGNVTPSDAGTSPILWISLISVGAVLISLGAVVVIFALRKKSE